MRHTLAVLSLALLAPLEVRAQSNVVGKWFVRYEREVHSGHMGSGPSQILTDSVHVTLRQKGDSILGEWQSITPTGQTAQNPRTLVGILRGETAHLEIDPSIATSEGYFSELGREIVEFMKEHVHGIPPMTTKLELTARGDSIVGTRWSASADGTSETSRHSVTGIREKP